jgi:hypothetical protein
VEHRQGAANDSFGQEVNPVFAGIHLRVLRDLQFHFLVYCRHNLSNSLPPAKQAAIAQRLSLNERGRGRIVDDRSG